jgi:hypothetical protein
MSPPSVEAPLAPANRREWGDRSRPVAGQLPTRLREESRRSARSLTFPEVRLWSLMEGPVEER